MNFIRTMPPTGISRRSRWRPIEPTKHKDTATAMLRGPLVQPFGRLVAVGAVALLLAASVAAPAGAMRRQEAVKLTNTAMGICFDIGGDPASEEAGGIYEAEENGGLGGGFSVSCLMPDGSAIWTWIPYTNDESQADRRSLVVGDHATVVDDAGAANHGQSHAHKDRQHQRHTGKHGTR